MLMMSQNNISHFYKVLETELDKKGWDMRKLVNEADLKKTDLAYTVGAPYIPPFDEVVKIADTLGVSLDIFRKDYTTE